MQTQISQARADRIIMVENEEQRSNAIKLASFLDAIERVRPPHKGSDVVRGAVDRNGVCVIQMFCVEGLVSIQTIPIEFPINNPHWTYERVVNSLADQYAAMMRDLFVHTFAPDLYNAGMSSVQLTQHRTVGEMDLT